MTTGNAEENADGRGQKPPAKNEKIHIIMEAASALTALGDEESDSSRPTSPRRDPKEAAEQPQSETIDGSSPTEKKITDEEVASNNAQRFLPEHKKPDAAPTFPEKVRNRSLQHLKHFFRGFACTRESINIDVEPVLGSTIDKFH